MHIQLSNLVFLVGFVAMIFIRGSFQRLIRGKSPALRVVDPVESTLNVTLMPFGLLLPLVYLTTPWLGFADYRLPAGVAWAGAVLMALSLWLLYRAHADLGANWSMRLELREGHQLVTRGAYRLIRHPMYASLWLGCLAQGMLLQNWLAGWYSTAAFAVMYSVRVPREERMLGEAFGQAYRDYRGRTGRLIPRLHHRARPDTAPGANS